MTPCFQCSLRSGWTKIDFSLAGGAMPFLAAPSGPSSAGGVDEVMPVAADDGFASEACMAFSGSAPKPDPARASAPSLRREGGVTSPPIGSSSETDPLGLTSSFAIYALSKVRPSIAFRSVNLWPVASSASPMAGGEALMSPSPQSSSSSSYSSSATWDGRISVSRLGGGLSWGKSGLWLGDWRWSAASGRSPARVGGGALGCSRGSSFQILSIVLWYYSFLI